MRRRWGDACYYCGVVLGNDLTLDHLVPRSRGGTSGLGNLRPACKACNMEKGNLTLEQYRDVVRQRQPAWVAMRSLAHAVSLSPELARPQTFRVLWALARVAGMFEFAGVAEPGKPDRSSRGGREDPPMANLTRPVLSEHGTVLVDDIRLQFGRGLLRHADRGAGRREPDTAGDPA